MAKEQTETILVPLSAEERQTRAMELAEVSEKVLTLEAERTEYLREKNADIKKLKRRVRDLVEAVRTGQEKCEAQLNFDEHPGNAQREMN